MQRVKNWWRNKLALPWSKLGLVEKVFAVLVGLVGGLFPIPALTTAVTLALVSAFKMNAAQAGVATAINLMVTPLEFILIPPLAQMAAPLTGADGSNFTASFLSDALALGVMNLLTAGGSMVLHAVASWFVFSAIAIGFLKVIGKKDQGTNKRTRESSP